MFRSLMTIIREHHLYLTKVIFMLKHSVKLRRYILVYLVMWQHVVERQMCCLLCSVSLVACVLCAVQNESSGMCVVCCAE